MHDERGQMIIPRLIPWGDSKFLQFRKGDLLRFAARKPAKEKQSQCMMRGTFIPQLPQEDPSVFILIGWTHPTFHIVSLEKKEKQCMIRGDISSHTQSLGKAPYSLSLLITT